MNKARHYPPGDAVRLAEMNLEMANWVQSLAPWTVFATLTFRWEASIWSAVKAYEKFMQRKLFWVSHFYAIEENPSRDGHHVHAIWTDPHVKRTQVWKEWFDQYGRGRIEPCRGMVDVVDYCSKYVTKERAWWDLTIKAPHRLKSVADEITTFRLSE